MLMVGGGGVGIGRVWRFYHNSYEKGIAPDGFNVSFQSSKDVLIMSLYVAIMISP
jgi:hypothetical protein